MKYDFSGYVTKNNVKCTDGRTIMPNAFAEQDGSVVPLVWNHDHTDPLNVLGNITLENRDDGVYGYGSFNDAEQGQAAKKLVEHGDITGMSICAGRLKENRGDVLHGRIKEVSLVLATANPEAFIDNIITHSDDGDIEEAIIFNAIDGIIEHSEGEKEDDEKKSENPENPEDKKEDKKEDTPKEKTVQEVFDSLNEDQKNLLYLMVGQAQTDAEKSIKHNDGGNEMKKNVFDNEITGREETVLTHADQEAILNRAKNSSCGSLREAINEFMADTDDNGELKHGFDEIETMFPDVRDIKPGAPELIERDQSWVSQVISKAHKTPYSRIRTRQTDIRDIQKIRAKGYKKGSKKEEMGNAKFVNRTTDPQTIYIKDKLNRDDIIDITDFDVVNYQYGIMRQTLNEELATAMLIGDGREEGEPDKIDETHIRPVWSDDDLYAIHTDVDITAAKKELQGANTNQNFGDNYIFAEAIITAALYSREHFRGTGTPDFYCTPHLLNVMLLAKDLNGRRIYANKGELANALGVNSINTVEQFEGKERKTNDMEPKTKRLLGIMVNMNDYNLGATKGGEITKFSQFDIDFNQEKYLIETRLSGALTKVYSAIVLEEDVTAKAAKANVEQHTA